MTPANAVHPSRPLPGVLEQHSTRMAFFVAGLGMAAWAPLVPLAKLRLGADEGTLGMLLLCLGMGSILAMPLTGMLAARYGCRLIIAIASLVVAACLPFLATASTIPAFAATLLVFGAAVGTVDVAVNIQAVVVERASGRSMMSGFHGFYSVGGIVGAGMVTAMFGAGLSPLMSILVISGIILALLLGLGKHLLPYGGDGEATRFAFPRGRVLLIGILCFILFLAEGSVLDWSGVFLSTVRRVDPSWAGLGYVAFAAMMTLGRLTGDRIVGALGVRRILQSGGLLAAAGFGLAVLVPSPITGVIGFGMVGAGASNVVPVLFTAAGRQTAMPTNLAISAITTLGYTGILTGPAAIGFVARQLNLSLALGIVAVLLVGVALSAERATE